MSAVARHQVGYTRRRFPIPALVLTLTLSACGGGGGSAGGKPDNEPAPTPSSAAANVEGTYTVRSVLEKTTFQGEKVEASDTKDVLFEFRCAARDCTTVYQRTDAKADSNFGGTYKYAVTGDTWTATEEGSGPCNEPATGAFTSRTTWALTRSADGSMTGTVDYVFTGCQFDGSRRNTLTVPAQPPGELPYLDGTQAVEMKRILTSYDDTMRQIFAAAPTCSELYDAGRPEGVTCNQQEVYMPFRLAVTALTDSLGGLAGPLPGRCGKAVQAVRDDKEFLPALEAALAVLVAGKKTEADVATLNRAVEISETFQPLVVAVASACVAPDDLTGLGRDGQLVTDVNKVLVVTDS